MLYLQVRQYTIHVYNIIYLLYYNMSIRAFIILNNKITLKWIYISIVCVWNIKLQ